jgi:hypothetical protein
MTTFQKIAAGVLTTTSLFLMAGSAMAGGVNVDVNLGVPGYYQAPTYYQPTYEQPRPYYVQPEREGEWRERHVRARHWQEEHRDDRGYGQGRRDDRGERHDRGHDDQGDRGRHGD